MVVLVSAARGVKCSVTRASTLLCILRSKDLQVEAHMPMACPNRFNDGPTLRSFATARNAKRKEISALSTPKTLDHIYERAYKTLGYKIVELAQICCSAAKRFATYLAVTKPPDIYLANFSSPLFYFTARKLTFTILSNPSCDFIRLPHLSIF